jgi:hypothetical protein
MIEADSTKCLSVGSSEEQTRDLQERTQMGNIGCWNQVRVTVFARGE